MLNVNTYGSNESTTILIQPISKEDSSIIKIYEELKKIVNIDFQIIFIEINDWNKDLSPWSAPSVFGKEDFGSGAKDTLLEILKLCDDSNKNYYLGGYSLAGLFSLWASFQTNKFKGIASVSGSLWFPNFLDYINTNEILTSNIYLSLGNTESKSKNKLMSTVDICTEKCYKSFQDRNINIIFEWNEGNHFKNPNLRLIKAYKWLLENSN